MKTIGIIGGGQLGMMIAIEAINLGHEAICLDPNPKCPASYVCKKTIVASYDSLEGLELLGNESDVITYEFENVKAEGLEFIKNKFYIPQGIEPLFDSQNRLREKNNALNHGLTPPRFKAINNLSDLKNAVVELGYPCVYKTTTMGYDGHGQVILKSDNDLTKVSKYLDGEGILEEFIDYDYETSVILVRSKDKIISFPLTKNMHKDGILDLSILDPKYQNEKLVKKAKEFMIGCDYYGILTIEFFVKGDKFYFNEMAPRPHNSGHLTIEALNTNQYKELVRFLVGDTLEEPKIVSKAIMKNILGVDYKVLNDIPKDKDIYIHDYHKDKVVDMRKMGHITFLNVTIEEYEKKYKQLFVR